MIVLSVIVFMVLWGRYRAKNTPLVESSEKILELTDKNFDFQTKNKTVLVDFWAEWCVPCRMMAPVLNDLADDLGGEAFVGKVNVEQQQELARRYQIRNIPTMILFRNGKEVNRFVGVKTKDYLSQQIKKAK